MNTFKRLLSLSLALGLGACGGSSGGSSSPSPPVVPPPPANVLPGGHWVGTVTNDFSAVTEDYIAMVDENGRFRFVSVDSAVQMTGDLSTVGNDLDGVGTAFADSGVVWLDGSSATALSILGTITSRDEMSGMWTNASGESGTFAFTYDGTFYERASPVGLLEGSWTAYDDFGNPLTTFTIAADGSFTGGNAAGCNSAGQFSEIDADYNLYDVQSTVANCPLAGDYTGFAFLVDLAQPNDAFVFATDNGMRAGVLGFQK